MSSQAYNPSTESSLPAVSSGNTSGNASGNQKVYNPSSDSFGNNNSNQSIQTPQSSNQQQNNSQSQTHRASHRIIHRASHIIIHRASHNIALRISLKTITRTSLKQIEMKSPKVNHKATSPITLMRSTHLEIKTKTPTIRQTINRHYRHKSRHKIQMKRFKKRAPTKTGRWRQVSEVVFWQQPAPRQVDITFTLRTRLHAKKKKRKHILETNIIFRMLHFQAMLTSPLKLKAMVTLQACTAVRLPQAMGVNQQEDLTIKILEARDNHSEINQLVLTTKTLEVKDIPMEVNKLDLITKTLVLPALEIKDNLMGNSKNLLLFEQVDFIRGFVIN
ncbi:hypothetical protein DSO57_1030990 [Entomophthora muscae]|uniref:Uncharacterized protein n=1 Tax=Entomophthora muscae TaxID=34485 RepID=A0ACC2SDR1_9FUNG|nr:hypothetical protein DSO57_1030990 [Entomophthora muscae]